jgi:hypothetical protein
MTPKFLRLTETTTDLNRYLAAVTISDSPQTEEKLRECLHRIRRAAAEYLKEDRRNVC